MFASFFFFMRLDMSARNNGFAIIQYTNWSRCVLFARYFVILRIELYNERLIAMTDVDFFFFFLCASNQWRTNESAFASLTNIYRSTRYVTWCVYVVKKNHTVYFQLGNVIKMKCTSYGQLRLITAHERAGGFFFSPLNLPIERAFCKLTNLFCFYSEILMHKAQNVANNK